MSSRTAGSLQRDLHRQVAALFLVVVPVLILAEFIAPVSDGAWIRFVAYPSLLFWTWRVWKSKTASAIPLLLAAMIFLGLLAVAEVALDRSLTPFDPAGTFGGVMLMSILVGALVERDRLGWAAGLGFSVGAWVIVVGLLSGQDTPTLVARAVVGVAGVIFTIALVSGLVDRLRSAVESHDRARRLNDAIAACSESLLVHSDVFALHEATRALLEATDADYAFVDRNVTIDGEPGWEIIAEASRRGVAWAGTWRKGLYSEIPTTKEALASGEPVVIRTSELPEHEARRYREDGIQSEVGVPVFVDGVLRGSLGFIQYTDDRAWTEDEIQTLRRASHMIGAYWQRLDHAEALRRSNESKDRLLSSVSHEIRTPLTAIVGLSEAIVDGADELGEEEVCELMAIIARQSRELAELVEDLLVASRADFGNLSIRFEPVELLGQVRRVVEGLSQSYPTSKTIVVDDEVSWAWADSLRVRQIIRNLISNAIKYGGSEIRVGVEEGDDRVLLSVSDNGPGVPMGEIELIFERYYRSIESPTMPGSVGIGLAVSRQLAELMDGTLEYMPGDWGRFVLSLPSYASVDTVDSSISA